MANRSKILVTGANGQLGKELKQLCGAHPQLDFIFLSREDLPVQNFDLLRNTFKIYEPQYCINCAAYTNVDKAEIEKDLASIVNGEAVGVLAAVCTEYETKFIQISTDYVFDGTGDIPYKEESPTSPINVYGASKLTGEEQSFQFNPDSIVLRTSWLYSEFGKNFVKTMVKLLHEKEEISVVNDQIGSPTYAADLAEVIIKIILSGQWHPGIYHYSNAGIISWYEFAIAIKEMTGATCKINPVSTAQYPTPARRPAYSVLAKTKIQQTFGIKLKDWRESLALCLHKLNGNSASSGVIVDP